MSDVGYAMLQHGTWNPDLVTSNLVLIKNIVFITLKYDRQ
jgi:hypothetical protein